MFRMIFGIICILISTALTIYIHEWGIRNKPHDFTVSFSGGVRFGSFGTDIVEEVATRLKSRKDYHLLITGHTGTTGDTEANHQLSLRRAETIRDLIISRWRIHPERIEIKAAGGNSPLQKRKDESDIAWQKRLARVVLTVRPGEK